MTRLYWLSGFTLGLSLGLIPYVEISFGLLVASCVLIGVAQHMADEPKP